MSDIIRRDYRLVLASFGAGQSETAAIGFRDFAAMGVSIGATWTAASLGFLVATDIAGTYRPLYDAAGDLVEVAAAASKAFAVPDEVFAFPYVKLWSQTAGVAVNQAAPTTLELALKS